MEKSKNTVSETKTAQILYDFIQNSVILRDYYSHFQSVFIFIWTLFAQKYSNYCEILLQFKIADFYLFNSAFIAEINYILQYIHIEYCYFNISQFLVIFL